MKRKPTTKLQTNTSKRHSFKFEWALFCVSGANRKSMIDFAANQWEMCQSSIDERIKLFDLMTRYTPYTEKDKDDIDDWIRILYHIGKRNRQRASGASSAKRHDLFSQTHTNSPTHRSLSRKWIEFGSAQINQTRISKEAIQMPFAYNHTFIHTNSIIEMENAELASRKCIGKIEWGKSENEHEKWTERKIFAWAFLWYYRQSHRAR